MRILLMMIGLYVLFFQAVPYAWERVNGVFLGFIFTFSYGLLEGFFYFFAGMPMKYVIISVLSIAAWGVAKYLCVEKEKSAKKVVERYKKWENNERDEEINKDLARKIHSIQRDQADIGNYNQYANPWENVAAKTVEIKNQYGKPIDLDEAMQEMDFDLVRAVTPHGVQNYQKFFDDYCAAHREKYHQEFIYNQNFN